PSYNLQGKLRCKKRVSAFVSEELRSRAKTSAILCAPLNRNGFAPPMNHLGVVLLFSLLPLRLDFVPAGLDGLSARGIERSEVVVLQELTHELRTRLQISEHVHVTLVDHNPLVMSVETLAGR